jgi:hypothetical protein
VRPPIALDASQSVWPIASADGIVCINMIHISPWEATLGLMRGAAAILHPESLLYLYGPYIREGFATTPSNQNFDRTLRDRNSTWGLRNLEAVAAIAQSVGFSRSRDHRNAREQSERGVPANVTYPWRAPLPRLSFSRLPDTCGWSRGSQLRVPFPSHRPDVPAAECWFRLTLFEPVAFPTLRRPIYPTAVELLADRSASPRPESDAAPSALEMG